MRCKQVQALMPELLRHELDDTISAKLEQHIAECSDCRETYESISETWDLLDAIPDESPSPALSERFHAMLDGYREAGMPESTANPTQKEERPFQIFRLWVPRVAAAVLIATVSFMVGRESGHDPQIAMLQEEVSQLKNMAATHEEVSQLKDMVTASLVNQQSASERLQGLSLASQVENPDAQFLSMLVLILNNDPNVNVRMKAVEALANFGEDEWVRGELVRSLAIQSYPLIQISLIEQLTAMNEQEAVGVMKAIADNENTPEAVRKSARWGMQQMI